MRRFQSLLSNSTCASASVEPGLTALGFDS
jgi:hypothetical protein